jgi:lysozyme
MRKLNRTVAFDGTPVFHGLALALHHARKHGWHGRLISADRRKGVAEKYGKLSQWALYVGYWIRHLPGYNPANPPGRSTHELRSDAVAYRGPVGRPLAWWQLGLDVTDSDDLLRILVALGYRVRRPYSAGSERHHLNFTRNPRRRLRSSGLLRRAHIPPQPSRISRDGLDLIASFEGWVNHVYNDPVGIPTIGYGHVVRRGEKWPARITEATGRSLLRKDAATAETAVRKAVKVPLTQNQFDALVCFTFNVGTAAFRSSTLLRKLNARDYHGAADEFLRWNKAGNQELAGLTRRRKAERKRFLS